MNEEVPQVVKNNRQAFFAYSEKVKELRKFILVSQVVGSVVIGLFGAFILTNI